MTNASKRWLQAGAFVAIVAVVTLGHCRSPSGVPRVPVKHVRAALDPSRAAYVGSSDGTLQISFAVEPTVELRAAMRTWHELGDGLRVGDQVACGDTKSGRVRCEIAYQRSGYAAVVRRALRTDQILAPLEDVTFARDRWSWTWTVSMTDARGEIVRHLDPGHEPARCFDATGGALECAIRFDEHGRVSL